MVSKAFSFVGGVVFLSFLAVAVYIFTLTQLFPPQDTWLAPIIPFRGYYGEDQVLPGISHIKMLEASGLISFVGLFAYSYARGEARSRGRRVLHSLALPLMVFGIMIALIVYTETHLLWGELWYGVKFLNVYPQGFPWGNERVASNTCFLHGSDYIPSYGANCSFFNYDQLLYVCIGAAFAGWRISRARHHEQGVRRRLEPEVGPPPTAGANGNATNPFAGSARKHSERGYRSRLGR